LATKASDQIGADFALDVGKLPPKPDFDMLAPAAPASFSP